MQGLESSAGPDYHCLAKTSATSGGKGNGRWVVLCREGGVWSELDMHGGSKGEGVPGDGVGSEPTGTGRGGLIQTLCEEPAIGSVTSLMGCTVDGSRGPQTHLTSRNIYYR